jgi:hypothetical protein
MRGQGFTLGFRLTRYMGQTRTGIHGRSLQKFRRKVRAITAREHGQKAWKKGKLPRTRVWNLIGVARRWAIAVGNTR